jgi:hypothetical protein
METKNFRLSLIMLLMAFSCVDHDLAGVIQIDCGTQGTISYVDDIQPIINTSCAITGDGSGCHNGGNGPDLDWRVFSNLKANAADVQDRITRAPGAAGKMPKIGTLTDEEIATLYCWVEQGALEN